MSRTAPWFRTWTRLRLRPWMRGWDVAEAKLATLGASMLLGAIAAFVFLLGEPLIGVVIVLVTVVLMFFVLTERDVVTILTVFAVMLMMIPSRFVLGPLGALGTPAKLVGAAALVWWLASRLDHEIGANHAPAPLRTALVIYLWWSCLTFVLAFTRPLTEIEASSALRTLLTTLTLAGVALLAADGIDGRGRLERLLQRIVALGGVVAIIGILQFFGTDLAAYLRFPGLVANSTLESVVARSDLARVSGTAIHAIEFGVVLGVLAPFALHFALHGRGNRNMAWFWTIAILAAIPTAVSRSGVVTLGVGIIVLAVRWTWTQRVWLGFLGLIMIAVSRAVAPGLLGTIRSLFAWWGEDDSITGRTDDFGPLYRFVSDSPWVGRGLGTFEPTQYFFVDNEWLIAAVSSGVIGVLVLLCLFVTACSCARGVRKRAHDEATAHLAQAFLASLLASLVAFGTFDALAFNLNAGLFFLIVGTCGALWRIEVGSWWSQRQEDGRLIVRSPTR